MLTGRRGSAGIHPGDAWPVRTDLAAETVAAARIRGSRSALLARGLWGAIALLALAEATMILATFHASVPGQWGVRGNEAVLALAWGSIGALIALRKPGNRVGWLLLALSSVDAFQGVVDQYPPLAAASRLPGSEWASWLSAWIWVIPSTGFLAFVPLVFPDGRLPSPRWRAAVFLGLGAIAVLVGTMALSIRPVGPLAPGADANPYLGRLGTTSAVGFGLYLAAAATGVGSLVLRYRRAAGDERQQMKWVAYALMFVVIGAVAGISPLFIGQLLFMASILLTAAAVGIAMLRYRLYEIDLIINRTLVYGGLSAILAGVYAASITLWQRVFMAITGDRSDASIVLTTLILAATFTPVKTRLQAIVDRRVKPAAEDGTGASEAEAATQLLSAAEERLREIAREEIDRVERRWA